MLQDICDLYELDTSSIIAKRKKPYIDLILDLIPNYTCQGIITFEDIMFYPMASQEIVNPDN